LQNQKQDFLQRYKTSDDINYIDIALHHQYIDIIFSEEYYKNEITKSHDKISELQKLHSACKCDETKSVLATQLLTEISSTLINANNSTLEYKKKLKEQENKNAKIFGYN
jgi:hypothetical protein